MVRQEWAEGGTYVTLTCTYVYSVKPYYSSAIQYQSFNFLQAFSVCLCLCFAREFLGVSLI